MSRSEGIEAAVGGRPAKNGDPKIQRIELYVEQSPLRVNCCAQADRPENTCALK